ncbi:type 1 glutamine amidotransferase domain-containing protein [Pseudalkalibacillus caeni]|uniref:Type 1 glutamine amidotransferase n=1 Tax=Exobacillus caeni TaxID=2574798 RepID=A0A5R9F387_9BACL|nr:type 1 glutamine amidotransferase domain-containing protein [Pseudalkalibacillus caeni]TLS38067.1 type 1 glutamine amidotransferase [Pseudalkalibacillus caeni]
MSKIAVLLTDMFEDVEYTDPAKQFKEEGHDLTVISDKANKEIKGKQGQATVTSDKAIDEVKPEEFDAVFIPGGFSPDQLRADDRFVSFVKESDYLNKKMLVICHGPQLLITAGVLPGRRITGYKSIQRDLEYTGAVVFDREVVSCRDQLISSRNPDDIPAFIKKSLSVLK